MKNANCHTILMTALMLAGCVFLSTPIFGIGDPQYLSGGWKIKRAPDVSDSGTTISGSGYNDSSWKAATVPGTALTSFINNGTITVDPNFGNNQAQIDDAAYTVSYWYRCPFTIPSSYSGGKVWLNFDGINWKADIYVNGSSINSIKGAFIRGKFDITGVANIGGTNYLAVYIKMNDNPGPVNVQTLASPGNNGGVLGQDNPTIHASIGWDWVPTIRGRDVGIQNDVFITSSGVVTIIDPFIITDLPLPNTAPADIKIKVDVKNNSTGSVNGTLKGVINPGSISFSQDLNMSGSETRSLAIDKAAFSQLSISSPRLWWPNGYGVQNMYTLDLSFEISGAVSDSKTIPFGIREMSYDTSSNLAIKINGKRIFCRGGNWGMDESMLRMNKEGYETCVRFHKDQNFTMIRNWIGMTCDEEFYNACDKYGILVWDDFWLANPLDGPDPADNTMFLDNAKDKIKRFRNHPSLALYCGRNEGTPPSALNTGLQNAIADLDGTRYYIPHSASSPVSGGGPYTLQDPKWYFQNRKGPQIHSEQGMPNVPPLESMQAMMPSDTLWPINDMWGIHDYCDGNGKASNFTNYVNNNIGTASGIADFCKKAQLVTYENYKAMFEAYVGNKGNGMLLWMSHPAWPSLMWQTYDYYLDVNGSYYGCKSACEPLHIFWDCTNEKVRVSNNSITGYSGLTAECKIYNMDGSQQYSISSSVSPGVDTVTDCFTITYPSVSSVHFLKLKLLNGSTVLSENFYWRGTTYKNYTALTGMTQVTLSGSASKSTNGNICTVTATVNNSNSNVALMARLKILQSSSNKRVLPTFYSDNYFSLLPNESKQMTMEFDTKYTNGENPKLMVEGWNIVSGEIPIAGGSLTPAPTETPVPTPAPTGSGLFGDVDSSGAVDIIDALLVAQFYVGLNLSNFNQSLADVNNSGAIDIVDALLIAQYYVGLISGF